MSRSRADSLLLISGILLLILVGLFFLTHRPSSSPFGSSEPAGEPPAPATNPASPADAEPAAPTDSDLAFSF